MKAYRKLTISLALDTGTSLEYYRSLNIHEMLQIVEDLNEVAKERKEVRDGR